MLIILIIIGFVGVAALIQAIVYLLTPNYPHNQAFISKGDRGFYYVRYNDKERSMYMSYSAAKDYASIFGGVVKKYQKKIG